MRRIILSVLVVIFIAIPVSAIELEAPAAPEAVISIMPDTRKSLGNGILEVLADALRYAYPDLKEAAAVCICVTVICILFSLLHAAPNISQFAASLTGTTAISILMLQTTNSLITLGLETLNEICEYGKLFFPVLAAALAAQGGITSSTQLYAATAVLSTLLSTICGSIMKPVIYLFLTFCIASSAIPDKILERLRDLCKDATLWFIKGILYIFTGYMAITGVISGTTDALALRATKMAISGAIPVVGSILSDASEAVLVSASMAKNTVGIYGLFVIIAIAMRPFLQIGLHYLILKVTGGFCSVFSEKGLSNLIKNFSDAMGLILAMVGATGLMLLVSIVCFLKGVG